MMKRILLAVLLCTGLLCAGPLCTELDLVAGGGPAVAAADDPGILEKYVRKLKWFHTEANPGQKIEVIEAALLAAKAGVSDAQLYLAYAYIEGVGVEQDREKGMNLLREAAENGSEDARTALEEIEAELERQAREKAPGVLPDPVPEMPAQ